MKTMHSKQHAKNRRNKFNIIDTKHTERQSTHHEGMTGGMTSSHDVKTNQLWGNSLKKSFYTMMYKRENSRENCSS